MVDTTKQKSWFPNLDIRDVSNLGSILKHQLFLAAFYWKPEDTILEAISFQRLMHVNSCNEFKADNTKTIDATLCGELVCGNVHKVCIAGSAL
uniref:Putative leucine-rich repeat receptor-like serine/threonine-protein kinase At5g15730 isoform X3 n=1 Tax=Rhizophora mucronata TaxID=61149 RepID=A0A2P2MWJ8_RHIMU